MHRRAVCHYRTWHRKCGYSIGEPYVSTGHRIGESPAAASKAAALATPANNRPRAQKNALHSTELYLDLSRIHRTAPNSAKISAECTAESTPIAVQRNASRLSGS
eukprot:1504279-Rhodomonas_salina.2